jgi:hypothetical protein
MFTIDRFNNLHRAYGKKAVSAVELMSTGWIDRHTGQRQSELQPCHDFLDKLDTVAGIYTRCSCGDVDAPAKNCETLYVGARLALHEEHLARLVTSPAPDGDYHHWLGRETMLEQPLCAKPSALMRDAVTVTGDDVCRHGGQKCRDDWCMDDCHCY